MGEGCYITLTPLSCHIRSYLISIEGIKKNAISKLKRNTVLFLVTVVMSM